MYVSYCEKCGSELKGNKFCETCGHLSKSNVVVQPVNHDELSDMGEHEIIQQVTIEKDINHTDLYSSIPVSGPTGMEKNRNKFKAIIILNLVVVMIISTGAYWWFIRNTEPRDIVIQDSTTSYQDEENKIVKFSESSSETISESDDTGKEDFIEIVSRLDDQNFSHLSGKVGLYVSDLSHPDYIYENHGTDSIKSASIIKLFIMMTFYEHVKEGSIRLDQEYILRETDKVGGTGTLQNEPDETVVTYGELVEYMIIDSDNTAGNILINLLDGPNHLTTYIQKKGYKDTKIERYFVDNQALNSGLDNYTSAIDVGNLLSRMYKQTLVSPEYDKDMLSILSKNKNHSKLPKEVDLATNVYNKTGEYADYGIESDAAIFEVGDTAYVTVVLTQDGDRNNQIEAMNRFGADMNKKVFRSDE